MKLNRTFVLSLFLVGLVSSGPWVLGADEKSSEVKNVSRPFLADLLQNLDKYRKDRVAALNVLLAGLKKNSEHLKENEKAIDTLANKTNAELRALSLNFETDLLVINLQRGATAISFKESNLDLRDDYRDVFPGQEDPNPETRERRYNEYLQKRTEFDVTRDKNLSQCRDMETLVTNEYLDAAKIILDQHNRTMVALDDTLLTRARSLSGADSEDYKKFEGALAKVKAQKSATEIQLEVRDAAVAVKRRQSFETTLLDELAAWRKNLTKNQISELTSWITPVRVQWGGTWYDASQLNTMALTNDIKAVLTKQNPGSILAGLVPDQVTYGGGLLAVEFQIEKNGKKRPLPEEFKDEAQMAFLWRIASSALPQNLADLRKFNFADGKPGEMETQLLLPDEKPIDPNTDPELAKKAKLLAEAIESGNLRRFLNLRKRFDVAATREWNLKVDGKVLTPIFLRNRGTPEVPKLVPWKLENNAAAEHFRGRWNVQVSDCFWENRVPAWLRDKLKTLNK